MNSNDDSNLKRKAKQLIQSMPEEELILNPIKDYSQIASDDKVSALIINLTKNAIPQCSEYNNDTFSDDTNSMYSECGSEV